jgi:hypothetical protein
MWSLTGMAGGKCMKKGRKPRKGTKEEVLPPRFEKERMDLRGGCGFSRRATGVNFDAGAVSVAFSRTGMAIV